MDLHHWYSDPTKRTSQFMKIYHFKLQPYTLSNTCTVMFGYCNHRMINPKYFFLVNSFIQVTKPYIIICSSKLLEFYITYNKQLLHEVRHDIMSNSKTGSELSASVFSFGRWQRHGVWSFKLSWRNQMTNAYLLQILSYVSTSHAFVY